MKYVQLLLGLILTFGAYADGKVEIKSVTAQQRYPWNGLVDIAVTMECSADDIETVECSFAATNSAAQAVLPIVDVVQNGFDAGSGVMWTRRFIWNATNDVGAVKIDDLALTVGAKVLGGVQLWKNGPYWAECNVGATMPEGYGHHFWWGDTAAYKRNADNNGWVSVKDGTSFSFTDSNCPTYGKDSSQLQSAGFIDSTGNLVAAHDAASAHLGAPWRMPTDAEFSTLISNCDTMWTQRNGVSGRLVTGRGVFASRSIFLPAAGYGSDSYFLSNGSYGYYWSSSPYSYNASYAWYLKFDSSDFDRNSYRYGGHSVRPVRGPSQIGTTVSQAGVTTHLKLDCRTGIREPAVAGEGLHYDASWCAGDDVWITDNGMVLTNGTVGVYVWTPDPMCSSSNHLLRLEILSGGQVVRVATAEFLTTPTLEHTTEIIQSAVEPTSCTSGMTAVIRCSRCGEVVRAATEIPALGYIRNVTARQLWPHNKVALEFTVAADIGEVKGANENLLVWCAHGVLTNVATQVVGDCLATPGIHRVIWDFDAEGLRLANKETMFGVSLEEIHTSNGGVQLWENGPYWAECNVGATKPEEYGCYFWWGDVVGYKRNAGNNGWISAKDGSTFSFSSGNCPTHGKNNSKLQSEGYIDSAGNLVAAYDAATVYLGAPWRMPTNAEIDALISNCTTAWITTNGVYGRLVMGKGAYASKSIFLPAAGYGGNSDLRFVGSRGYSWSSTIGSGSPGEFYFNSSAFQRSSSEYRYFGCSVRPLRGFAK